MEQKTVAHLCRAETVGFVNVCETALFLYGNQNGRYTLYFRMVLNRHAPSQQCNRDGSV